LPNTRDRSHAPGLARGHQNALNLDAQYAQCPHRHRRLRIPYPTSFPTMSNSREPGGPVPAPLGAGERASTPASPACQPAFQTRRPTDPTAPPCPRNRQAPDHRRHSAALTMCSRCEGAVQNGRRTYINPAPSPFKRPTTGSLQDRRATRVVSGEAGYRDHSHPLSRAFLHRRDDPQTHGPAPPAPAPAQRPQIAPTAFIVEPFIGRCDDGAACFNRIALRAVADTDWGSRQTGCALMTSATTGG